MRPVALCSSCGATQKTSKDMFFLVKRGPQHSHYHRLCTKCSTGAPRKALEADGYVDHQHTATR